VQFLTPNIFVISILVFGREYPVEGGLETNIRRPEDGNIICLLRSPCYRFAFAGFRSKLHAFVGWNPSSTWRKYHYCEINLWIMLWYEAQIGSIFWFRPGVTTSHTPHTQHTPHPQDIPYQTRGSKLQKCLVSGIAQHTQHTQHTQHNTHNTTHTTQHT